MKRPPQQPIADVRQPLGFARWSACLLLGTAIAALIAAPATAGASRARTAASRGLIWAAQFGTAGLRHWDAFDGNASSRAMRRQHFAVVRNPSGGRARVFEATVDQSARGAGESGQRSLLELFPDSEVPARARAAGAQGRNQWFHGFLYFPARFKPYPQSDWNWVIEWHQFPNAPCCANVAIAVNAQPGRPAQLALSVEGGGTARYPADSFSANPRVNRTVNDRMIVGGRLRRRHWYNIVLHIVWDYRARHGLVQWWLDGRRVFSRHRSTLYYYRDAKPAIPGNQPGAGRTYLELGYYRGTWLPNGRLDRVRASVYQAGDEIGNSWASVAHAPRP